MALDIAAILTLLMGEQKRKKHKAEQGKGDGQDALHDAFIDAILPELSSYFLTLFEEQDTPSLLRSLNAFVLTVYQASPDALQFLIRLMSNVSVERWQDRARRKNVPAWALTAPMVFIKAYFNALKDMSSKNKAQNRQTTPEDIEVALNNLAKKAKETGSDLNAKFTAAQQAVRDFASSHTNKEDPNMGNPHANPPPKKDGDDKKKGFSEFVDTAKDVLAAFGSLMAWWGDRGEDHVQEAARALFWVPVALLVTAAFTFVAAISPRDEPMALVTVITTIFWTLGPFAAYWVWRERNASLEAENEKNPAERPGNGVIELGMLSLTSAFVGSISMLVLAAIFATAAYTHFARVYVWAGMAAIGSVFITAMLSDMVSDGLKTVTKILLPKNLESPELSLKHRVTRSFGLIGVVYGILLLYPVGVYVLYYTDYTSSTAVAAIYFALEAGFAHTRLVNEPSVPPPEGLRDQVREFTLKDHRTARKLLLFGATLPVVGLLAFNFFVPPECPTDPELAPRECPVELPTYAERWHDSQIREIGSRAGSAVTGFFLEEDTAAAGADDACSERVDELVQGIASDDCKVILEAGTDPGLIALCEEARDCGALAPDGRKVVRVREEVVADIDDWGVGEMVLAGLALIGAVFIGILILAAIGGGEEKKEGPKGH